MKGSASLFGRVVVIMGVSCQRHTPQTQAENLLFSAHTTTRHRSLLFYTHIKAISSMVSNTTARFSILNCIPSNPHRYMADTTQQRGYYLPGNAFPSAAAPWDATALPVPQAPPSPLSPHVGPVPGHTGVQAGALQHAEVR